MAERTPMAIRFRIPGPAVPKARARTVHTRRGTKTFTPRKTKVYERTVALLGIGHRPDGWPIGERYAVTITVPAGNERADLDNVAKSVLDGLNKIAWHDDRQVDDLHVFRDGGSGVGVEIVPMTGPGALPADLE